jgi:hypothetical protein
MYKIEGMAFDRQDWMRHTRNRLCGALGEFAKVKFAEMIDFPFDWKPEVRTLMSKVVDMFDQKKTKRKGRYDVAKMFSEVLTEAAGEQVQITQAKNDFIRDYIKDHDQKLMFLRKTREAGFTAEALLCEMLETFAPELTQVVKK